MTTCTSVSMRNHLKPKPKVSGSCDCHMIALIGKTVLKKKVKFTVTIVPVKRARESVASTDQTCSVFDGQTHSMTFQQTAGSLIVWVCSITCDVM